MRLGETPRDENSKTDRHAKNHTEEGKVAKGVGEPNCGENAWIIDLGKGQCLHDIGHVLNPESETHPRTTTTK